MTKLALTDEDHEAITRIHETVIGYDDERNAIALHFLRAGIEEAAKVCDAERNFSEVMPMREPEEREYARGWRSACWGCAAAVRALLK